MGNNHWRIQGDPIQIFLNFMQFLEIFGKKCIWASPPKVGTPPTKILDPPLIITARLAKRAKVMFSEASVCPTPRGWTTPPSTPPRPGSKVTTYLPPKTTPPSLPLARVKGHNSSLPPGQGQRSQHLPPPATMRGLAVRILLECILVFVCVCLLDLGQTRNIRKICELAYSQNKIGHQVLSETCWPCKQIQRWKTW